MNKRQQKTVDWILEKVEEFDFHSDGYEFKCKDIKDEGSPSGLISVVTEVGLIGDESTLAEVFARTRRLYFVGPRGGIRGYDGEKDRVVTGREAIFQRMR